MKIGDEISVVDEDLRGKITSVHGQSIVFKDEHGFTYHYKKEKLVLQNPSLYQHLSTIKKEENVKSISKKHHKKPMILDLHFDNLVKNPNQYDAFERLFIQKEKLIETFDFCRKNNLKKLEIIHGIGDGVLQKLVFDFLISQLNIEFDDHDFFYHQSGSVLVTLR